MKLTKVRPLTEKEELNKAFPNLKDIKCEIHSDTIGNIIYVNTTDKKIIKFLQEMNFKEKS